MNTNESLEKAIRQSNTSFQRFAQSERKDVDLFSSTYILFNTVNELCDELVSRDEDKCELELFNFVNQVGDFYNTLQDVSVLGMDKVYLLDQLERLHNSLPEQTGDLHESTQSVGNIVASYIHTLRQDKDIVLNNNSLLFLN